MPCSISPDLLWKIIFNPRNLIFTVSANAQLRGEQRLPPNLKHCAINTKTEVEAKVPSVENPS
ncbi:hypothetical protein D0D73_25195 [Vibrio parahaemolyticus]|nr:hypothetical protein [Vibrio parahaemolyticus]EGR1762981.1 hypothetical protein [Vibrio parahaemolyticus]